MLNKCQPRFVCSVWIKILIQIECILYMYTIHEYYTGVYSILYIVVFVCLHIFVPTPIWTQEQCQRNDDEYS